MHLENIEVTLNLSYLSSLPTTSNSRSKDNNSVQEIEGNVRISNQSIGVVINPLVIRVMITINQLGARGFILISGPIGSRDLLIDSSTMWMPNFFKKRDNDVNQ